jgi:hypothetical protein
MESKAALSAFNAFEYVLMFASSSGLASQVSV